MSEIEILTRYMTDERVQRLEEALDRRTREICVVIDRLDKPHNYMAIMRTCDAFGIQDLHIVPLPTDTPPLVSAKVTQGAHKWLTVHQHDTWQDCVGRLRAGGYRLYASSLCEDSGTLDALDLGGRLALIFGNELNGLTPSQLADCDGVFMLPMRGLSQSFNVSVACALSLQALMIHREHRGVALPPLTSPERESLRREWYRKACPNSDRLLEEAQRRGELGED